MRTTFFAGFLLLLLASCSYPVLRSDLLEKGARDVSMVQMAQNPSLYEGKLFILGGSIVSTNLTETGSVVEAIHIPVDSNGYLRETEPATGRFLAFYARELGILDPVVYKAGRRVTLAAELVEMRPGRIGEMDYIFPYFNVRQLYLWEEGQPRSSFPTTFFSIGIGVGGRW
jgi:outer membrane lipoprotein